MFNYLNESQEALYAEFRAFVAKEVVPHANQWDREQALPDAIIKKVASTGYLGGRIPKKYGGQAWDLVTYGLLNEAIGYGSISLTGLFNVHTMIAETLLKWGNEAQKDYWLPKMATGEAIGALAITEPGAGSDMAGIDTTFTKDGSHIVINGTKRWITCGAIADVYIVLGKLDGKACSMLVERNTPGLKVTPVKDMLSFRAGHLAVLEFDNCRVDAEQMIAKPGFAFTYVAPYALEFGRVSVAWAALGLVRACLETCSKHVMKRKTFNELLINHGAISGMITDMGVDWEAAKYFCYESCCAKEQMRGDARDKILMAKYFCAKATSKHTNNAVQIMGALGCNENSSVARYYRDCKALEIIEGSNEIHQKLLGIKIAKKMALRADKIK